MLKSFGNDATDLRTLAENDTILTTWKPKLEDLLAGATDIERVQIERAVAADSAIAASVAAGASHQGKLGEAGRKAGVLASFRVSATTEDKLVFEDVSGSLAREIGCGLVWEAMKPEERSRVQEKDWIASLTSTLNTLRDTSQEALVAEAERLLAGRVSGTLTRAVELEQYVADLKSKAEDIVAVDESGNPIALSESITGPTGAYTRAYFEYAKQCLAPPT